MRDSLRTSISQFSSAGGRQQARAANVRAAAARADLPGAERGNLYMLIEVLGGGGHPAIYRRVLDAAQKAFYETEGSLTTALQRAVRSAHSELRRINEALPEAPLRAGITCVALQGADATVAQVNPALALISHPRTVDQFPPEVEPDSMPMGGAERPDVQLIHTRVEPSTMILLAESRWLEQVQPRALAVAVALEDPVQAVEYLSQLAGDADLNALVIGISQGLPASRLESEAGSSAWQSVYPDLAPELAPEPEPRPAGRGRGLLGRLGRTGNSQPDAEAIGTRRNRPRVQRAACWVACTVRASQLPSPPCRRPAASRWVTTRKMAAAGNLLRCPARQCRSRSAPSVARGRWCWHWLSFHC